MFLYEKNTLLISIINWMSYLVTAKCLILYKQYHKIFFNIILDINAQSGKRRVL